MFLPDAVGVAERSDEEFNQRLARPLSSAGNEWLKAEGLDAHGK